MAGSGTVTVNFGAFPGQSDALVTVSAPGIAVGSLVEAWILPAATADHSADEHSIETLTVKADQSSIVAGTSFVVRVSNTSQHDDEGTATGAQGIAYGGQGTLIYGAWNIGWVWV